MTYEDHQGNLYDTLTDMCRAYGISLSAYKRRRKAGWGIRQSLTTPTRKRETVKDHLGNEYPTIKAMCANYSIAPTAYNARLKQGYTQEEALTMRDMRKIVDHKGKVFSSVYKMCKEYGISTAVYYERLRKGMKLEEVLTTPLSVGHAKVVIDSRGNRYRSMTEFAKAKGITVNVYRYLLRKGLALEEIENYKGQDLTCKDHLGNNYMNASEMCSHYGIAYATFKARIKRGMSLEQALTTPVKR